MGARVKNFTGGVSARRVRTVRRCHRRPRQKRWRSLGVTGRWSRLDRRVRSVAAEGVRFGLMTGRWVAQRLDAGRVRPVSADVR